MVENKSVIDPDYEDYMSLEPVKALSEEYHKEIKDVIMNWTGEGGWELNRLRPILSGAV